MFDGGIVENVCIDKNRLMQVVLQNSRKKRTITQDINRNKSKYFIALFTIGTLNQISYNLTQNSAQNIANRFEYSHLISVFQTTMILMASWTILINSLYMIHVDYKVRIYLVVSLQFVSLLITALANITYSQYGFWLCTFSSALIGMAQGLGEASVIGTIMIIDVFRLSIKFPSIDGWILFEWNRNGWNSCIFILFVDAKLRLA